MVSGRGPREIAENGPLADAVVDYDVRLERAAVRFEFGAEFIMCPLRHPFAVEEEFTHNRPVISSAVPRSGLQQ